MTLLHQVYVVVKMENGREALPVWTIPYVVSWHIGTEGLLLRLIEPNRNSEPTFPTAFSLDGKGKPILIPSPYWIVTKRKLELLDIEIKNKELSPTEVENEWEKRSIDIIIQNGRDYVWLDEFKDWLERLNNHRIATIECVDNEQG